MYLYLSFIFFFIGMNLFFLSLILKFNSMIIFSFWDFLEINSVGFSMLFLVDWFSLMFMGVVFVIFSMILIFSKEYMEGNLFEERFIYLLILFVMSMMFMIFSPSILSIMLGWDGLGLVSYCLIIFNQNKVSADSGFVTIIMNRVGDIFLLMMIGVVFMNGSWNLIYLKNEDCMYLLILVVMTKSAQFPFSGWLPLAMTAPTPVSALVHSSTLVTAGVYFLFRSLEFFVNLNLSNLLILALFTMFFASFMANLEFDLKKIVALSTLSQLGLMMVLLSLNMKMLSFFHLIIHAFFKSLLFMCVGYIIHISMGIQDLRFMKLKFEFNNYLFLIMLYSILSMSGFFFLSGFYSKDLILESIMIKKVSGMYIILFYLSCVFTVSYSMRMLILLIFGEMKIFPLINMMDLNFMMISIFILWFTSVFLGFSLNWLIYYSEFKEIYFNEKFIIILIILGGMLMGVFMQKNVFGDLIKVDFFFLSMWFLDLFMMISVKEVLVYLKSGLELIELGWLEVLSLKFKNFFLNWSMMWWENMSNYKILFSMMLVVIILF